MKKLILIFIFVLSRPGMSSAQDLDSANIRMIYNQALIQCKSYDWLRQLTQIGSRLSGTTQAAQAVQWAENLFQSLGVTAFKQECMVPRWVRGPKEQAFIHQGMTKNELAVCALGGSIATPKEGITAAMVEIKSWERLETLGKDGSLKGKFVFYNRPFDPKIINTFEAYGNAVDQRWAGAMRAAPYGAVGVLVRSMSSSVNPYPHTGSMGYNDTIPKIPACAISTADAEKLSTILRSKPQTEITLKQFPYSLPDTVSYNVIGEIRGSEFPDEIITIGGHLDSWDLGEGAHDDGAGCVQAAEVLYLLKSLNIQPKRTVRAVMFMNEENGGRGGAKYAELAVKNKEKHIAAIESDAGGFTPKGFSFKSDSLLTGRMMRWKKYFEPYDAAKWFKGYGGADINHLEALCPNLDCLLLIGLSPDSQRYFEYHHSVADTFDKVNRRELALGSAAMASLVYLLATYGIR